MSEDTLTLRRDGAGDGAGGTDDALLGLEEIAEETQVCNLFVDDVAVGDQVIGVMVTKLFLLIVNNTTII